jgi:hypothetical protein
VVDVVRKDTILASRISFYLTSDIPVQLQMLKTAESFQNHVLFGLMHLERRKLIHQVNVQWDEVGPRAISAQSANLRHNTQPIDRQRHTGQPI